jgi:[acyl-carrier-protein] S-malonyltransferase
VSGAAAVLFPGQGAQELRMGLSIAEAEPAARRVLDEAEATLGLPLRAILSGTDAAALNRTDVCQPAILAVSLAAMEALAARGKLDAARVTAVAGLSLGEYSALAWAGALPRADALRLVRLRGEAMQRASEERPSGMLSLVGADEAVAAELCEKARGDGVLVVANLLAPGQVAIAGTKDALDRAQALIASKAVTVRKAVPLTVAGAFHSPCMESAAAALGRALDAAPLRAPRVPVIMNVTGEPCSDPARIRELLRRQITSTVRWQASMQQLFALGCTRFLEPEPGRQLTNMLKRYEVQVEVATCGSAAELDALANWPGGGA